MEDAINSDELSCPLLDVRHRVVVPVACDYEHVVVFWFLLFLNASGSLRAKVCFIYALAPFAKPFIAGRTAATITDCI